MISKYDIIKRVERIIDACRDWNAQAEVFIASEIAKRRKLGRSLRIILKALIGLSFFPPKNASGQVVLFQGLRCRHLFPLFSKKDIYLLGSWRERKEAQKNGYGFIPDFPIDSAFRLAVYRGITLAASNHLWRWSEWISKRKVTAIIYEDTQPVGAFLALLTDHGSANYRAVCIQHGHYCGYTSPYRPEGRLTEYNLVWDTQQGGLISGNQEKTHVIGLPYQAAAKPHAGAPIRVIFVGLGSECYHAMTIEIFKRIASALHATFEKVTIAYRPHPNEFCDPRKIADCEQAFDNIDRTPKIELLNGPWTIFFGEVSSLLYEAKQAGHFTAFVPIDAKCIPTGYHDITVDPYNLNALTSKLLTIVASPPLQLRDSPATGNPIERFIKGTSPLGLNLQDRGND